MLSTVIALVGLLTQATAGASSPQMIAGQVLDEESRAPLAGAEVRLTRMPQFPIDPQQPLSVRVHADGEGRFEFVGVASGRYFLNAQLTGYARPSTRNPPFPLVVTDGEPVPNVELRLGQSAGLSGRVLTSEGRPAHGVAIYVRRKEPGPPGARTRMSPVSNAYADREGAFRVDDLAPGDYYLQAVVPVVPAPGPALTLAGSAIHVPTYFPGTTAADAALPVAAVKGVTTDIGRLQMLSAAAFQVTGTVVDAEGRPVAGAMVRLVPADAPAGALPMSPRPRMLTPPDGAFLLEGVLNGRYRIVAVPPVEIGRVTRDRAGTESSSSRVDALRGRVETETRHGVTLEYRDELAGMTAVEIDNGPATGIVLTIQRRR